jgi:hypothetical protein
LFLGEVKGFESYSKVGVIVPINGKLVIETTQDYNGPAVGGQRTIVQEDEVKPNPTVGFLAALGTSYKLGKIYQHLLRLNTVILYMVRLKKLQDTK